MLADITNDPWLFILVILGIIALLAVILRGRL